MRAIAALLVLVFIAGCVSAPTPAASGGVDASDRAASVSTALAAAPKPALDGKEWVAWLQAFVDAHHPRVSGTPDDITTADDLAAQMKTLGYAVETPTWNENGLPSVNGPYRAVLATKKGTTHPDELIVIGAHYDTSVTLGKPDVPGVPVGTGLTLYAAYDNGSGTAMVREMAKLLANVTTERTIIFAFFNGEEEGLKASHAYSAQLKAKNAHVKAYVGFDMIGINWPSKAGCLCIYAGKAVAADLNPIQEATVFGFLHYPRDNATVQVFDNHDTRNSDEGAFASAGFPTMRWAGMKSANDYWAYHKLNDTIDTMTAQAGGMDALVAGVEKASESAYYVILATDRVG